jgi:hypothetical protein
VTRPLLADFVAEVPELRAAWRYSPISRPNNGWKRLCDQSGGVIQCSFYNAYRSSGRHYFFVPQVQVANGDFLWLSAPKPITGGTGPFAGDLQAWTRDQMLDPDWLRVGTDIVGGATPPTFNLDLYTRWRLRSTRAFNLGDRAPPSNPPGGAAVTMTSRFPASTTCSRMYPNANSRKCCWLRACYRRVSSDMRATAPALGVVGVGVGRGRRSAHQRGARTGTLLVGRSGGHLNSRPGQAARRTRSTFSVTFRDASSAVCTDISAIRCVPLITPSRWSRNASLWAAARSCGVRQRIKVSI